MTAVRSFALLAAAVLVLSGCAAIQRQQAADSKQILTEAGFRVRVADEPGLPARQLVAQTVDGTTVYKFSDPDNCNCLYVGGPTEYAELQRLRAERVREHEQLLRAWGPWTSADPRVWGPWKPEGLDLK
jgi:uncharacterized protein YceK